MSERARAETSDLLRSTKAFEPIRTNIIQGQVEGRNESEGSPSTAPIAGHDLSQVPARGNGSTALGGAGLGEIAATGAVGWSHPAPVGGYHQTALGNSVNSIRIYSGDEARRACDALGTPAYTYEGNVVLSDPNAGSDVVDHEIYHAARQRLNGMDVSADPSRAVDPATENEANAFAAGASVVSRPSSVPRLSFYTKKTLVGKEFRVSDDEKMAVRQDTNIVRRRTYYGSKHFYAEPSLISTSSATLKAQKSALSLSAEPGVTLTVKPGKPAVTGPLTSPRFSGDPRLEAIMKKRKGRYIRWGSRGDAVKKIQQALVDAGHPLPKFGVDGTVKGETTTAIKSFQISVGLTGSDVDGVVGPITLGHLDRRFGGGPRPAVPAKVLHRISAKNVNTGTEGLSMELVDDCGGAAKTVMMGTSPKFNKAKPYSGKNVRGVYKMGGVTRETPVFTTSKQVRDHIIMKIMGKPTASAAMAEYWSKSAAERDVIDKEAGINKYAEVKTGESHSIVRGDSVGWNWHWGAVVMQSGADSVTVENFAGSGSQAWDFQMYATTGSKSFHMEQKQRLQRDEVSPEYGHKPITVRIKPA